MNRPGDEPAGLADRRRRQAWSDDAAILGFDLADGGARPPDDPAEKLRRLVERAGERYEAGEFQTAIGLADKALALDPSCLAAWLWKAHSLIRLRNLDGAIAELTRARKAVRGPEAVGKVDELLDTCRRHLTDRPVEQARRALRDGQHRAAVTILEQVAGRLAGDETFDDRLTYARERATATPGTALTLPALQKVLGWLCREETTRGDQALDAQDYRTAAGWFVRARERDDRHTAAALGEATALFAMARDSLAELPPTWAGIGKTVNLATHLLQRADLRAQSAAADRTRAESAAALRTAVAELTKANDALGRRANKNLDVSKCIADYNAMIRQFEEGDRNWLTSSNLLTTFPAIEARAHRLYKKYGPDDPDVGPRLASLRTAVTKLREEIRW